MSTTDPLAVPIDVRTVGDLCARDVGARVTIPDLAIDECVILAVEHFAYKGETRTDLSVSRHGGMVVSPTITCEVTR